MAEYPFKEKIRERLELENKKLPWLLGEIDKSESWWHKMEAIAPLQIVIVEAISNALGYNFLFDYVKWKHAELELPMAKEPTEKYKKEQEMSIQLTVKGGSETLYKNVGKILEAIADESAKVGLKVG